ncbi:MAG: trypsin-like peptidase domain-containing protein [Anaerolineaceae bacterium]|nr:trypsin-like peptidase domain-containing protein [Anaerolineaceae bacterium]
MVSVIYLDNSEHPAILVNGDIYEDLAVLKMEGPVPGVISIGNSDLLQPGESVIAIGSPLGAFKNTVTVGVISGLGRSLETDQNDYIMEGLIQTDAAINSGNSGGPLVNLAGELIGINTFVVRSSGGSAIAEGLGFSNPSNKVQFITNQIIQAGYFSRPYLGLEWQPISPTLAARYDLPVNYGAFVVRLDPAGPAAESGVQAGDIIVQIGDTEIDAATSYTNALFQYQPDETIVIRVSRDGEWLDLEATLGELNIH